MRPALRPAPRVRLAAAYVLLPAVLAGCQGVPIGPEGLSEAAERGGPERSRTTRAPDPVTPEEAARRERLRRTHFVRSRLEHARQFRREGRTELAERALRDVLELEPDHVRALRALATLLEETRRDGEAAALRERADRADPRPPPPPETPLAVDSAGVTALVRAPQDGLERGPSVSDVLDLATERLRVRLPEARIEDSAPESVPAIREWLSARDARAVLSLRVERASCADTVKDGPFSLAALRVSAAGPAWESAPVATVRALIEDPRPEDGCVEGALARAIEDALALPAIRRALEATPATAHAAAAPPWPSTSVRALFPRLTPRIQREIRLGVEQLATGRIAEAAESFRRAVAIDPEDADALAYLAEAEETLAVLAQLPGAGVSAGPDAGGPEGVLDPQLTPARRAALERRLAEERMRRAELLSTIALTRGYATLPPPDALEALRPVGVPGDGAAGPHLARDRARGAIEARALYGSDGDIVARFYFERGQRLPLLREEDKDGDGRADLWIGYRGRTRHEMWEDGHGTGWPDIHWVFLSDGREVERIEIDSDTDRRAERILRYAGGRLASEERDTDGDGALDRKERFNAEGEVEVREEDLDGDGSIDVVTRFHRGRLVSREINDPRFLQQL